IDGSLMRRRAGLSGTFATWCLRTRRVRPDDRDRDRWGVNAKSGYPWVPSARAPSDDPLLPTRGTEGQRELSMNVVWIVVGIGILGVLVKHFAWRTRRESRSNLKADRAVARVSTGATVTHQHPSPGAPCRP